MNSYSINNISVSELEMIIESRWQERVNKNRGSPAGKPMIDMDASWIHRNFSDKANSMDSNVSYLIRFCTLFTKLDFNVFDHDFREFQQGKSQLNAFINKRN